MTNKELTRRQEQLLQAIHVYTDEKGFPPTISDLRSALGVASDQAVLELLGRLERGGFIIRETGQARGIKITPRGYAAIGVQPKIAVAETAGLADLSSPLRLTPRQQLISENLSDIHPKLAQMYMGALHALMDKANPDRIAQSAHSMREITAHLSKSGEGFLSKNEEAAAQSAKSILARKLEKVFDPLGGVGHLDQNVYDTWNREFHQFFVGVGHHKEVSLEEYLAKISDFEEFLLRYIFPLQTEIYDLIDSEITKGPKKVAPLELKLLLSRNVESYTYFLKNVDATWLEFLNQNGLLKPSHESATYLSRAASDRPEAVIGIIMNTKVPPGSMWMKHAYIEAASHMPVDIAVRLISKIRKEKWIENAQGHFFTNALDDLLKNIILGNRLRDAVDLTAILLDVRVLDRAQSFSEVKGYIDDYQYSEILQALASIPAKELNPFLKLLVRFLCKAIALEERDSNRSDHSYIWRPAIEDHEQNLDLGSVKDGLVIAIRDLLEKYIEVLKDANNESLSLLLDEILRHSPNYPVLTRLKLHIYRLHPQRFKEDIAKAIFEYYDDIDVWHEYALLLEKVFPDLDKTLKDKYFSLVAGGPKERDDEAYIRHWILLRLAVIKKHLSPEQLKFYSDLLDGQEEPSHVEFSSYRTSWVGPTSPVGEEELSSMQLSALVKYLLSWTPERLHFAPSRQGLGRELALAVKKRAAEFSASALVFADPDLRPVYLYHFFSGLREALGAGAHIAWKEVIRLACDIVQRAQSDMLPDLEKGSDDWETKWDGVFQWLAKFLEDALKRSPADLSFEYRKEIWYLISYLCEHPDPTPDHERKYGGSNSEPFTMSVNTVRGQAFHAVFAYIFWCNRHSRKKADVIMPEVKLVLKKHLEITHDPSLTIRSVYGRYFPWLFSYDPKWTRPLLSKLFPKEDKERRYAAWETYLANSIFQNAFIALRPQYEWAIDELKEEFPKRRYFVEPKKRLAEHIMIAYAYGVDKGKNPLFERFFKLADGKYRGMAVSFAGRAYLSRENQSVESNPPDTERLQKFWEWRLSESTDVRELQEFGWWMTKDKLESKWLLQMLIETLKLTHGVIAGDFLVMDTLAALAKSHTRLCVTALQMIILASRKADRMFILSQQREIEAVLLATYKSADEKACAIADKIVDHLTKSGFESYRLVKTKSLL